MIRFTIEARHKNGKARAGIIETAHGKIHTPAFIPVGTKATVKSLLPESVKEFVGSDAILANTYHIYLQPGTEVLRKAGGLGKFMNWSGPTYTDSGGFQAFSLGSISGKRAGKIQIKNSDTINKDLVSKIDDKVDDEYSALLVPLASVDDDGVTFKSVIDGSTHRFTPERSIEIQHDIGADMIFAFDECILPGESYERQKEAVERTKKWAKRCLDCHKKYKDGVSLLGIVQGGRYEDLRKQSARDIGGMDFDGFGIGGSFDKEDIGTAVGWVNEILPENKPRHLLGIGSEPWDIIDGIENGVDTFDCVAPTRIARNGAVYVFPGTNNSDKEKKWRLNMLNSSLVQDFGPIDSKCDCYVCKNYSRAYVAHLFRAKEMLAATLASIHNLHFMVNLAKKARQAIIDDRYDDFKESMKY